VILRLIWIVSAVLIVAACNPRVVNVSNQSGDKVIVQVRALGSYLFYQLPPGQAVTISCTGCGDSAPNADYVMVQTAACALLVQAPIPDPVIEGTYVVSDGPTVTFDPADADFIRFTGSQLSPCR
jgi:hypothetical protein